MRFLFFPAFFIDSVQAFHSSPTFIKEDGKKPIKKKGGSIMSCGKPHKKAKKKAKKKKK